MPNSNPYGADEDFSRFLMDGILDKGWKLPTIVRHIRDRAAIQAVTTVMGSAPQELPRKQDLERMALLTELVTEVLEASNKAGRGPIFPGEQVALWRETLRVNGVEPLAILPERVVAKVA